jgi:hypothetical protein
METRHSPARIVAVIGIIAFMVGLVLGKDQGDAETARNTLSAILLTIGFLAVVGGLVAMAVGRFRRRNA